MTHSLDTISTVIIPMSSGGTVRGICHTLHVPREADLLVNMTCRIIVFIDMRVVRARHNARSAVAADIWMALVMWYTAECMQITTVNNETKLYDSRHSNIFILVCSSFQRDQSYVWRINDGLWMCKYGMCTRPWILIDGVGIEVWQVKG